MNAVERIADALTVGGKVRGFRKPIYTPDNKIDHYARQHVELEAGDVLEVCGLAADQADRIVADLTKGCACHEPGIKVTILADDAFHILEKCGHSWYASIVPTPPAARSAEPVAQIPTPPPASSAEPVVEIPTPAAPLTAVNSIPGEVSHTPA